MVYSKNDHNIKKRVTFVFSDDRDDDHNSLRLKTTSQPTATVEAASAQKSRPKSAACKDGEQKIKNGNEPSNKKHKRKLKPKKCFVRHPELPQSVVPGVTVLKGILKHPVNPTYENTESKSKAVRNLDFKSKFSVPELYTSLGLAKKISSTKMEKINPLTDIPPQAKQAMDEKAACRLNFPFEEQIYRDLVALNVSDEDLLNDAEKHVGKELETLRKDREPQLKDFFIPQFGKEYDSVCKILPCNVEKIRRYNGHSVYDRTQLWEDSFLE